MTDIENAADYLGVTPHTTRQWQEEGVQIPDDITNADQLRGLARWVARKCDSLARRSVYSIPDEILHRGYRAGLIICGAGFFAIVIHLFLFQWIVANATPNTALGDPAVSLRAISSKMALLSSGMLAAVSLGFLGFGLFLIGVRGSMDVEASAQSYQAKLANVAPGTLILLCAFALTSLIVTRDVQYKQTSVTTPDGQRTNETSFAFAVPLSFVTAIREPIDKARNMDDLDAQRRQLERVWFLAESLPSLINELESEQTTLDNKSKVELDALKTALAALSAAETDFRTIPDETINSMSATLDTLEQALK